MWLPGRRMWPIWIPGQLVLLAAMVEDLCFWLSLACERREGPCDAQDVFPTLASTTSRALPHLPWRHPGPEPF